MIMYNLRKLLHSLLFQLSATIYLLAIQKLQKMYFVAKDVLHLHLRPQLLFT